MTCVAHAFAMALYCGLTQRYANQSRPIPFPNFEKIFERAFSQSPDKNRGVAFEAIAQGVQDLYASYLSELGCVYSLLPNDAYVIRQALRRRSPVIVGYQVDEHIDSFHKNRSVCAARGYMLPFYGPKSISISGHAVLILGYDFRVQSFIARNSWGSLWGVQGHFLIPFGSVENTRAFTDIWALIPINDPALRAPIN